MMILYDKSGQLCNRLFSMLPSITLSLSKSSSVIVLFFDEYFGYFPNIGNNENIKFLRIGVAKSKFVKFLLLSLVPKCLKRIKEIFPVTKRTLAEHASKRVTFVYGWDYKYTNIEEYLTKDVKDRILELFKPPIGVRESLLNFFSELRKSYDVVVGVHIRRGDYKDFHNGKFFFNWEVFDFHMMNIEHELNVLGRRVCFIICSNEEVNISSFGCKKVIVLPESSEIKDLYGLSLCDLIIGVPSTYSQWASFYGNVPISFILDLETKLKLKDFKKIVSLDRYDDGTPTYEI